MTFRKHVFCMIDAERPTATQRKPPVNRMSVAMAAASYRLCSISCGQAMPLSSHASTGSGGHCGTCNTATPKGAWPDGPILRWASSC